MAQDSYIGALTAMRRLQLPVQRYFYLDFHRYRKLAFNFLILIQSYEKYLENSHLYFLCFFLNFVLQIRFRRGLPPGDGVLFYPGEVFSSKQLVASVRLERILSGLQVLNYSPIRQLLKPSLLQK